MDFRSARGVYVVLDATEIHRDWYLAGLEFQLLRFLAREAGLRPLVPSSVFAEAVANHGREYARARRTFLKAVADLRRVGGTSVIEVPNVPIERGYANLLAERLDNLFVEIADPPQTPHHEIVARAVSRRPPFDQSGSGYRDTLTWMTCVELAATGGDVYLVTQDKDFAGKDLSLAPELAEEVAAFSGCVTLVRQLGKWLTPLSPWRHVSDLREAAALARDDEVASLFAPWDRFEAAEFTAEELGLPPTATIHEINYHGSGGGYVERVAHEQTASGADLVTYEFPIEFEVELSLSSEEARAAGFLQHEGNPTGREVITTMVPMTGLMSVVHDERDMECPIYFERFEFVPITIYGGESPGDNPDQLVLPLEP